MTEIGYSGPIERCNRTGADEGSITGFLGTRNLQTAAYSAAPPPMRREAEDGEPTLTGGGFWAGRANDDAPPNRAGVDNAHFSLAVALNRKTTSWPGGVPLMPRACIDRGGETDLKYIYPAPWSSPPI